MSGSRCGAVVVENAWPQGKRPSPYQSNRCVKILDLDARFDYQRAMITLDNYVESANMLVVRVGFGIFVS